MSMTRNEFRQEATIRAMQALIARIPSENFLTDSETMATIAANYADSLASEFEKHGYFYQELQRPMIPKDHLLEADPLVMYIMRHFDDVETDKRSRQNRAEAALHDYEEHKKRNARRK